MYLRGTVWGFRFEPDAVPEPALIVSNNARNESSWPHVHVVRITTASKQPRATIVEIPPGEGVAGRVICDDLAPVPKAQLGDRMGALSPATMRRVDQALKAVLALR
ncbi:MAG TPA: type II toxin-antitoxin system PemK/MazF family toxin [Acidimicrobiia bacterium]|nr:type II toxin-antitoxin system PemK/MazF family toxin [Acidimicrobiia bacterium]